MFFGMQFFIPLCAAPKIRPHYYLEKIITAFEMKRKYNFNLKKNFLVFRKWNTHFPPVYNISELVMPIVQKFDHHCSRA